MGGLKNKDYPVHAHDHPIMDATRHLQNLEWRNGQLKAEVSRLEKERDKLLLANRHLRRLAMHGMLYRLDGLIKGMAGGGVKAEGRIRRLAAERCRVAAAYERLYGRKL